MGQVLVPLRREYRRTRRVAAARSGRSFRSPQNRIVGTYQAALREPVCTRLCVSSNLTVSTNSSRACKCFGTLISFSIRGRYPGPHPMGIVAERRHHGGIAQLVEHGPHMSVRARSSRATATIGHAHNGWCSGFQNRAHSVRLRGGLPLSGCSVMATRSVWGGDHGGSIPPIPAICFITSTLNGGAICTFMTYVVATATRKRTQRFALRENKIVFSSKRSSRRETRANCGASTNDPTKR